MSMTRKLVENGRIFLDGTETEEEKERLVFLKAEIIQDYESEFGLDTVFVLRALKKDTIYIICRHCPRTLFLQLPGSSGG